MKLLGIDYGSKRIGLATGDTIIGMAFPKTVIQNDDKTIPSLREFVDKEGIEKVILGESKNLDGSDNLITESLKVFKDNLEKDLNVQVVFVPEFYSTYQASRIQGDSDMIDASAATIILQSYLDKLKNN